MRTMIALDDDLVSKAQALTGPGVGNIDPTSRIKAE
jgi:hypothetical protein